MIHCQIQTIHAVKLSVSHHHPMIVFVLNGKCTVKRFSKIKDFKEGDVFFINRNEVYAIAAKEECVIQWIELDGLLNQNRSMYFLPLVDSVGSLDTEKEMAEIYRDCVFLKNLLHAAQNSIGDSFFEEICEALKIDYLNVNPVFSDMQLQWLSEIMHRIEEHLNEKISLQSLSEQLNMQKTNLATQFKQLTGLTLMEAVTKLRLKKAEELLLFTAMSQQEILKECGFSDSKYFYRYFMEEFGMTPSAWKEKMKTFEDEKIKVLTSKEAKSYLNEMLNQLSGLKTETKLYQQACRIRALVQNDLLRKEDVIEVDLLHSDNYIEAAGERINAWYGFDLMMNELKNHQNQIELNISFESKRIDEELDELFVLLKKSALRLSSKRCRYWKFVLVVSHLQQVEQAKRVQTRIEKEFGNLECTIKVV